MEIRDVTFVCYYTNGTVLTRDRQVINDDEEIMWIAEQIAEVNNCGVVAIEGEKQICIVGNVQQ